MGRGSRTRVTPRTVSGMGFDPCLALGFPPWHAPSPPPGWSCSHTSDKPRRSAPASSDPLAPAQGVPYPNPVFLECPVLCTAHPLMGTIVRLPHRFLVLCFWLTVQVPPLSVTLPIHPLYHCVVPTIVPYLVMDTRMLSAVFLRRLILSSARQ